MPELKTKSAWEGNLLCSELNCIDEAKHGAHGTKQFGYKVYIIPTCVTHNPPRSSEIMNIKDVLMVPSPCEHY